MTSTAGPLYDGLGCDIGLDSRGSPGIGNISSTVQAQHYASNLSSFLYNSTSSPTVGGVSSDDGATESWQSDCHGLDSDQWDDKFADCFGSDTIPSRSSSYQGNSTYNHELREASTVPTSPGLTRPKVPTDYHLYGDGPKDYPPGRYILDFDAQHVFWLLQSRKGDSSLPEKIIIGPCPVEHIFEEGQEPPQLEEEQSPQSQHQKEQKSLHPCGFWQEPHRCEKKFGRAADRDRHETSVHRHEKGWYCSERSCPRFKKVFFRKDHGLVHVRSTHKNRKGVHLKPVSPDETIDASMRLGS